ncbi:MAG TPA: SUMF1/EgtB/PvdO family nonheme iron enzyme [Kofleriaceae bacterium]|jgi:formylglycine-generating enzyme required for sulfatase activity|nr:SUMF1/EgtB/PvdO family nonheme iron enzyme [Kofleriaceae bacterium]
MRARLAMIAIAAAACPAPGPRAEPACPDGMVRVPRGTFAMGSPDGTGEDDEHPRHPVTISAFCIDRTEVTVKAYEACVAANRCTAPHREISPYCNQPDRADHPVNCVDWHQAVAYCRWRDNRLPTEAEWEYAARGSDGRLYPWGNEPPSATRLNACGRECVAWGKRVLGRDWPAMYDGDDGWVTTAPVGSFPAGASPFGALDMAGNVWEWTADWRGSYPAAAVTDPRSPATGSARVDRGNGWHAHLPADVRAAVRDSGDPALPTNSTGLRCAASR